MIVLHPSNFLRAIIITSAIYNAAAAAASPPDDVAEAPIQYRRKMIEWFPRVHVKVWDKMPEGSNQIQVQCKSRDNDIGLQYLGIGNVYTWSFYPNARGTTLFSCVVRVGPYARVVFNGYYFARDFLSGRCTKECTWTARADGVHGFNQKTQSEDKFLPWAF